MNRIGRFMSKRRVTWLPYMAAGTPIIALWFVVTIVFETVVHWRAMWHYEWRYQWRDWFHAFSDQYRARLHSLGLKPEPGGTLMQAEQLEPGGYFVVVPMEVAPDVTIEGGEGDEPPPTLQ